MSTTRSRSTRAADDYLTLVRRFPLVPIKSDRQLREAFRIVDELSIIDEEKLTRGQADYLLVLSDLVEKYEQERRAIDLAHVDAVVALKHLMESNDMSASDLGRLLGNRALGAAILRRERQLSKAHIVTLSDRFNVSADLFLRS